MVTYAVYFPTAYLTRGSTDARKALPHSHVQGNALRVHVELLVRGAV